MRRGLAAGGLVLVLGSAWLSADDLSVQFDRRTDFSAFRTFAIRRATVDSPRPELDNPLFVKKLGRTIHDALVARGLTETATRPDLVVDYTVAGEDFGMGVPTAARGVGPRPVRFTEGTVVIDLTRPGDSSPVWRGVYRDEESTGSGLVKKLPEDARKLIGRYPRRSR